MEDEGRVVEDEVDTGPLLEGHDQYSNGGPFKVATVREKGHVAMETELDARRE